MSENPKMEKTEQKKTTKKAQRKQKKSQRKNGFGYAFIQTKYGKRILITQGENKIWLREEDLIANSYLLLQKGKKNYFIVRGI